MEPTTNKAKFSNIQITTIIVVILFLLIGGYALARLYNSVAEPEIQITAPTPDGLSSIDQFNNLVVSTPRITIQGKVSDIVRFSANGDTVYIDEQGNFSHTLLLHEGINYIEFVATDKFGRQTKKQIKIIYKPMPEPESQSTNTTTDQETQTQN